jgi:hypothetical protein
MNAMRKMVRYLVGEPPAGLISNAKLIVSYRPAHLSEIV